MFPRHLLLVAALLTTVCGCGSGNLATYPAGGKVVFADGQPLKGGWVEFRSINTEKPLTARGQIQPDGAFELGTYRPGDGAVEGEHAALVMPPMPEGRLRDMRTVPVVIDPRFSQFETSGLKFSVTRKAAENQFVIQVDRPKGK